MPEAPAHGFQRRKVSPLYGAYALYERANHKEMKIYLPSHLTISVTGGADALYKGADNQKVGARPFHFRSLFSPPHLCIGVGASHQDAKSNEDFACLQIIPADVRHRQIIP